MNFNQQFSRLAKLGAIALTAMVLSLGLFAQSTPFLSVPLQGSTTFAASTSQYSSISVASAVQQSALLTGDPLAGQTVQFSYYFNPAATTGNITKGSSMAIAYGGSGFILFADKNGGGVGWHIKQQSGWALNKSNNAYNVQFSLEAPFWLGDPPANVSPALVQMMNASSATIVLQLQNTYNFGFGDLQGVGRKGKLAGYSSYGFTSNGSLNLYH